MAKKFFEKIKSKRESIKIFLSQERENNHLRELDYQLCDWIKSKSQNLYYMGGLHSLIFYPTQKMSGILARYVNYKNGKEYLGTNTFIDNVEETYLGLHRLQNKIFLNQIYDLMKQIFIYNMKELVKKGHYDRMILEKLIKGTKEENDIKKGRLELIKR